MKIFISWSGDRSWAIGNALHTWLPYILPGLEPFMSDRDIDAGAKWASELTVQLEQSQVAVLCLTPENLNSSWLMFEAGAVSKAASIARVVPVRFMLNASDIRYPLAQFQSVDSDHDGIRRLVHNINTRLPRPWPEHQEAVMFSKFWCDLESELSKVPRTAPGDPMAPRSERDILIEILGLLRSRTGTRIELPFPLLSDIEATDLNTVMDHAQATREWISSHAMSADKRVLNMVAAYSSELQTRLARSSEGDPRHKTSVTFQP